MQLLLIPLAVIGLTSVQVDNAKGADQEVKESFRSLFDSIKRNDVERTGTYRNYFERETAREQQVSYSRANYLKAFNKMKVELKFMRQRSPYHKDGEVVRMFKREAEGGGAHVDNNLARLENALLASEDLKTRLDGALTALTAKLNGLRAGRATTSLLEPIKVDVYGAQMSINQLGTISVPEPRLLAIQVWDKTQIPDIEKAIMNSGLGLNPMNDGNVIRIPIPAVTEERRRDMTKKVGEYGEQGKVAVRNLRRDGQNALKKRAKNKELSEDELALELDGLKVMIDNYLSRVEDIIERKTKEIMEA